MSFEPFAVPPNIRPPVRTPLQPHMLPGGSLKSCLACLVHDQETFWAMDGAAVCASMKVLEVPLGQLASGTTTHYPEPVLKLH